MSSAQVSSRANIILRLFSCFTFMARSELNTTYPTAAPGEAASPVAIGIATPSDFGSNLGNRNSFNLLGSI